MRAWEVRERFGVESLTLGEREEPRPGPGEILLAVRSVSLNYRDLLMVRGAYDPRQPLPLVPCSDGVGEVVATGDGVTTPAVGDRVCPIFAQRWLDGPPRRERVRSTLGGPLDGTLRERMVVPAESVVAVPEHLTDAEAACLPCAWVTAWNALVTHGGVTAGQTVLLLGTGGVSSAALQLSRAIGARAIVTSRSAAKLERARELGAWQGIDTTAEPQWARRVKSMTGGDGVDLVVEVGGAATLPESLRAVKYGGTIALIGVLSGHRAPLDLTPIFMRQVRVQGILVGHRESFRELVRAVDTHRIRPQIHRRFPFTEAPAAFEALAEAGHVGKLCIDLDADDGG